jgi:hypothetical protein
MIDLDNTAHCTVAGHCENCGRIASLATVQELAAYTAGTPIGVYCLTLCDSCSDDDDRVVASARRLPEMSLGEAARRVAEHCQHLGIDLDQMADALKTEALQPWPRPRED